MKKNILVVAAMGVGALSFVSAERSMLQGPFYTCEENSPIYSVEFSVGAYVDAKEDEKTLTYGEGGQMQLLENDSAPTSRSSYNITHNVHLLSVDVVPSYASGVDIVIDEQGSVVIGADVPAGVYTGSYEFCAHEYRNGYVFEENHFVGTSLYGDVLVAEVGSDMPSLSFPSLSRPLMSQDSVFVPAFVYSDTVSIVSGDTMDSCSPYGNDVYLSLLYDESDSLRSVAAVQENTGTRSIVSCFAPVADTLMCDTAMYAVIIEEPVVQEEKPNVVSGGSSGGSFSVAISRNNNHVDTADDVESQVGHPSASDDVSDESPSPVESVGVDESSVLLDDVIVSTQKFMCEVLVQEDHEADLPYQDTDYGTLRMTDVQSTRYARSVELMYSHCLMHGIDNSITFYGARRPLTYGESYKLFARLLLLSYADFEVDASSHWSLMYEMAGRLHNLWTWSGDVHPDDPVNMKDFLDVLLVIVDGIDDNRKELDTSLFDGKMVTRGEASLFIEMLIKKLYNESSE